MKTTTTIGIDLGDRTHAVCVMDEAGEIRAEERVTNTRACLEELSRRRVFVLRIRPPKNLPQN